MNRTMEGEREEGKKEGGMDWRKDERFVPFVKTN